jgi:transcriptional regulator with XRE-family HTH domain
MVERILMLIQEKGLSVSSVERQLHFGNGAIKRFSTNSPSIDKIIALSNFLNVSIDYLVSCKEKTSNEIITIGNQNSTITNSSNFEITGMESEDKSNHSFNENTKELVRIFESLPKKGQIRLLNIAYDYEEKYREENNT